MGGGGAIGLEERLALLDPGRREAAPIEYARLEEIARKSELHPGT